MEIAEPVLTATGTCPACGAKYTYPASDIGDRLISALRIRALCGRCSGADEQPDEFTAFWRRHIGDYASADPARVPPALRPALSWRPSGNFRCGIGITGGPGEGKSMALALAVRNLRRPFRWATGTRARDIATDAANGEGQEREGARRTLNNFREIPVLVLDDMDKPKFTDAWASKLFELLEHRNRIGRVTLWTSNNDPSTLAEKIGRGCGDRFTGQAIERRLCQSSLVIAL